MDNSEKEKYTIGTPSDVWRISIGRRSVFITEKTYKSIKYLKEYREQMFKAKESRKTTQSEVSSAENLDAGFGLAWSFLANVAERENKTRDTRTELNKALETAEESLKKCKMETMEAIAKILPL